MLSLIQNWKGAVEINGQHYDSIEAVKTANLQLAGEVSIKLLPISAKSVKPANTSVQSVDKNEVRITVKQYMTKKGSPDFDFMQKWNNDNPMPYRTMTGTVEKETRGMVYMKLHGDIWTDRICTCMKCGKVLTNPVSQYFGIGPECGGHNYVHPFDSDEELKQAVDAYKKQLQNVTWEGWVIKSAITEKEVVA